MSKHPTEDDEQEWSIIGLVKESALLVLNTVTSKTALRTYLSTLLFFWLTLGLLGVSTIAYWVFYNRYIPQPRIEREVYLQFGDAPHPHGTVFLPPASISSLTPYDISISLHLPRTPTNLAVGNFMLDVSLHGLSDRETNSRTSVLFTSGSHTNDKLIAHARRPAILTYTSPVVDTASTISWLPFYLLGWSQESEHLKTPIFQGLEFDKGIENLPQSIDVVLEAYHHHHHNEDERITTREAQAQAMQVYDCRINIVAKLGGLKWIMYNHRIVSYAVFTGTFWAASVTSFLGTYFVVTMLFGSSSKEHNYNEEYIKREEELKAHKGQETLTDTGSENQAYSPVKREQGGLSDTPRTFPSLGRRTGSGLGALRYTSPSSSVKKEEEDREEDLLQSTILQPLDADDEDEDEGLGGGTESFRDSGIGTGRDDERRGERGEGVQQRRRRGGGGDGGGK